MIGLDAVYILAGLMFGAFALQHALDAAAPRRWANTAFWGAYAATFLFGSALPDAVSGLLVLLMVVLAGLGRIGGARATAGTPEERRAGALRFGDRLFVPALVIPAVALLGTLFLKDATLGGRPLIDPKQVTLVSLGLGVIAALAVAYALLRPRLAAPLTEGRRLIDAVGWAAVLPQLLAALGALFLVAGVGKAVAEVVTHAIPLDNRFVLVAAYTVGMALFTVVMGNAFAAFPVMTAGIGLPLIVNVMHGDPIVMSAIGMLSGFCGTLMTPMAANFNIVPAALLELPDRNGVIKVQIPTGLILLGCNTLLMYWLVFRGA
ncbi:DUF979 domain-containing protein [Lichenibacterium ramalinae]|uniref:DUF979 domain-containing protein n=1 Tax=Lichenibacterium ramalinae TaxID=2316527 RepID=A0A4Q2R9A4_9HYPH|nr:DUF979 domain-containing protein [Lichenibacterium ramalinae]RYB02687.1 DUF979 domain-containing protein [Lichenibacterium ramalinae]